MRPANRPHPRTDCYWKAYRTSVGGLASDCVNISETVTQRGLGGLAENDAQWTSKFDVT
jgi:hypothetical protein